MFKKGVVSVTMVGVMMVSNVACAGFSLKKMGNSIGGGFKKMTKSVNDSVKKTASSVKKKVTPQAGEKVDLSQLSSKQRHLVRTMNAAMLFAGLAHNSVGEALGKTNTDLVATTNLIRADHDSKDAAKKIGRALKSYSSKDFDAVAKNGSAAQKARLKSAMEQASLYNMVSKGLLIAAAAQTPGLIKEAGMTMKTAKDLDQLKELSHILSTCRAVAGFQGTTSKYFGSFGKASANAKALLNPAQAKLDSSAVRSLVRNAQDGNF